MKKILSILTLTTLFISSANAIIVADPTSHAYFLEQISQLDKNLKTAQKTYNSVERTAQGITKMGKEISGSYNNIGDAHKTLKSLNSNYNYMYRRLSSTEKKIFGRKMEREKSPIYKDLEKVLKESGYDSNSEEIYSATDLAKARLHDRQLRMKESLMSADIVMSSLNKNVKRLETLSQKIDKTENIKDSQDLTNRLLVEQLLYLDNMTRLLATFVSSSVAIKYSGYDELKHDKFKLSSEENKNKKGAFGSGLDLSSCYDDFKFGTKEQRACKEKLWQENLNENKKRTWCTKGLTC